jgi:D-inositol-3-phosphate glycosyltransferase
VRKLLWVGDAAVSTGFAKATHQTLEVLRRTWDVHVIGLNYNGDPHAWPYPIYTCWPGGDAFGVRRTAQLGTRLRPDVTVVQNDPWNVPEYLKAAGNCPVVASMPVDGKNCRGAGLNGLAHAIFWTQFGLDEARAGGYNGPASVVPLGVDLAMYAAKGEGEELRKQLRKKRGIPEDAFIIGNVNRNQPRKRLDLTIRYFARWIREYNVEDAYLFLHVAPTGDQGYDVDQLARYYGVSNRMIVVEPDIGQGVSEEALASAYQLFDVQVTTTQGEGWGLCTMEGMACGVPQIVPDWSALGEWIPDDCAIKVPCTSTLVTPNHINAVGGVPDENAFIEALQKMRRYTHPDSVEVTDVNGDKDYTCSRTLRDYYRDNALALVRQDRFRWENIGQRFADILDALPKQKVGLGDLKG